MANKDRFLDKLRNVIDRIILPKYPEIGEYSIERWEDKMNDEHKIYYMVQYPLQEPVSVDKKKSLKNDTISLFMMLGPSGKQKLVVNPWDNFGSIWES